MAQEQHQDRTRIEWIGVAALAVIGFGLRAWPIGRLGLTHFDEGIYALVATWSMQPKGIASLDPLLIPYAPPGYPILCGLACWFLGRSDGAMIGVSQVAGTLTIPVVAWLARRTFGPGAGFAAATFCALSGPHIAFSRMGLTDASFLLAWLIALGTGMRFLERPNFTRALVLGLAVGLAQDLKYNGWLAGGLVIASAIWGVLIRPEERRRGALLKTFGWGGLAAVGAWLVVWPWYAFVEAHGGYAALLRHQQSYLGESRDWPRHFAAQLQQATALSGGPGLPIFAVVIAIAAWTWERAAGPRSILGRIVAAVGSMLVAWSVLEPAFVLWILMLPWLIGLPSRRQKMAFGESRRPARLLAIGWVVLMVITPLYHPYARLWLPIHALHWILMGWLVAVGLPSFLAGPRPGPFVRSPNFWRLGSILVVSLAFRWFAGNPTVSALPGLFAPSDSLYRATVDVASRLPERVKGLRLLVRPPVTYYLAGRVSLYPMAGSDQLRVGGDPDVWVLVDSAILRSELGAASTTSGRALLDRFADRWEVVEEFPTTPSLPTLLDLDPRAASPGVVDRSYPLWLLRPRASRTSR